MRLTWARTVASLTTNSSAISWLLNPWAISCKHRQLARRQRLRGGLQVGRMSDFLQELAGDGRVKRRLTAMHLADRANQAPPARSL